MLRKTAFRLVLVLICSLTSLSWAQGQAPISATTVPAEDQIQPAGLAQVLTSSAAKPLVLEVGPRVFYQQARIKGAEYAGPGSNAEGGFSSSRRPSRACQRTRSS
jgi:hypothetical protein